MICGIAFAFRPLRINPGRRVPSRVVVYGLKYDSFKESMYVLGDAFGEAAKGMKRSKGGVDGKGRAVEDGLSLSEQMDRTLTGMEGTVSTSSSAIKAALAAPIKFTNVLLRGVRGILDVMYDNTESAEMKAPITDAVRMNRQIYQPVERGATAVDGWNVVKALVYGAVDVPVSLVKGTMEAVNVAKDFVDMKEEGTVLSLPSPPQAPVVRAAKSLGKLQMLSMRGEESLVKGPKPASGPEPVKKVLSVTIPDEIKVVQSAFRAATESTATATATVGDRVAGAVKVFRGFKDVVVTTTQTVEEVAAKVDKAVADTETRKLGDIVVLVNGKWVPKGVADGLMKDVTGEKEVQAAISVQANEIVLEEKEVIMADATPMKADTDVGGSGSEAPNGLKRQNSIDRDLDFVS